MLCLPCCTASCPRRSCPPWRAPAQGEKRVKRADVMGYRPAPRAALPLGYTGPPLSGHGAGRGAHDLGQLLLVQLGPVVLHDDADELDLALRLALRERLLRELGVLHDHRFAQLFHARRAEDVAPPRQLLRIRSGVRVRVRVRARARARARDRDRARARARATTRAMARARVGARAGVGAPACSSRRARAGMSPR